MSKLKLFGLALMAAFTLFGCNSDEFDSLEDKAVFIIASSNILLLS